MKITPKTEKEIAESGLLPEGIYGFEVVEATDEISKKGNEMIKLKLHVYDDQGEASIVFDYLMESIAFKLRHAADACRLLDKYEAGEISAFDFLGKTGQLKLGIQKDKTGQYADRNSVKDYIVPEISGKANQPSGNPPELDDSIPF